MIQSEFSNPHSLEKDLEKKKENALPLSLDYLNDALRGLDDYISKESSPNYEHEASEFIAVVYDCLNYMNGYRVGDTVNPEFRHLVESVASTVTKGDIDFKLTQLCGIMHKFFFAIAGFDGEVSLETLQLIFDGRFQLFSRFLSIITRTKFVKPYIVKLSESTNQKERELAAIMMEWLIFK